MTLSVNQLIGFGLSPETIDVWEKSGVENLLPLQEKALAQFGFLHGNDLLVLAPTSSGKTMIAEMAALKQLADNRRVVYLVPTKALAEEKYRNFSDLYGPLGYRVAIATRERPDTDRLVMEGRYDWLIAVYEKMKSYLVARPEMLNGIGLVIADEIQTLGEAGRGATVDLLLTKIRKSPYPCQFLGLSAVLGEDAKRLAQWLNCQLLIEQKRPLELLEGVYDAASGAFHYRAFNSGEEGSEILAKEKTPPESIEIDEEEATADFRREAIFNLAAQLALENNEQVIVFVPTRYVSRNWAHRFAQRYELDEAAQILKEIENYEDTFSRELLIETLRNGIAFHNADLSWDLRELVEAHFNSGEVRVLFSTSTLGQGVNLTGRNVIHVPVMVENDVWTGRPAFVSLSRSRFRNQGGRGARFSREEEHGRSMLLATSKQETDRLIRDYVHGEIEALSPRIAPEEMEVQILDLISSGICRNADELTDFFHDTFSGRSHWPVDSAPVRKGIENSLEKLAADRFIRSTTDGAYKITGIGETAAGSGMAPASVRDIADWLEAGPVAFPRDPLEALLVMAITPDGQDFPVGPARQDLSAAQWIEPIRERLEGDGGHLAPAIAKLLYPEGGIAREGLRQIRMALCLDAWIGPGETREIEERHHIFSGSLANMAAHFAWLVQGAAAIARSLAKAEALCKALDQLAGRLVLGCSEQALPLKALRVPGLSRAYLMALTREGYTSIPSLKEAGEAKLAEILPSRIAKAIFEEIQRKRRTKPLLPAASGQHEAHEPHLSTDTPLLRIDRRGAGKLWLNGEEIYLPPLPFQLISMLAEKPGIGLSYEEIEDRLWSETQVERQQLQTHRRTIIAKLGALLSEEKASRLLPIIRGRGMRLDLTAQQIEIIET